MPLKIYNLQFTIYNLQFRNGKGVIAVPQTKTAALLRQMQDDYNLGPKRADLVEEIHVLEGKTLFVNIFVRITAAINDSWDEEFQLKLARVFGACLSAFGVDDRKLLYVSAQHNPDDKTNLSSNVNVQSQVCVTSSMLRHIWFYFHCLLQQQFPQKGWDQAVDLSAASDTLVRLRMNYTHTYQPCPRCSVPRSDETSMTLCFRHRTFIPGEFRVINVIDLAGIPCPHELARVRKSKINEWLACSIRPAAENPVHLTLPLTCPPAPVVFNSHRHRGRKKDESKMRILPGQSQFTHVEWLVRNHFPPQWRSIFIAELNWSPEEHFSLYAEGLGSHICTNPSAATMTRDQHFARRSFIIALSSKTESGVVSDSVARLETEMPFHSK